MKRKNDPMKRRSIKLFISSDIEGTAGITSWDETDCRKGSRWYEYFCQQMTREVAAACEGAIAAGAEAILVKDAHDAGLNLNPAALPPEVQISRGWSGGLFAMVGGLSSGFDAVAFTGYHSPSYSAGSPLSHTMAPCVDEIIINGKRASEFTIHSYVAAMLGVPVVFVSGDAELCRQAKEFLPAITAVPVSAGEGGASVSQHPDVAVATIRDEMERALLGDIEACRIKLPPHFSVKVRYKQHQDAYHNAFYPGAQQLDEKTIAYQTDDYYEVMRFFSFVL